MGSWRKLKEKETNRIVKILGKHCGASLGRHAPFSSMETKSRIFEDMSISGDLSSNAR